MPDPNSLNAAMRKIRTTTMATLTPYQLVLFEQLYTAWRNSMTDAGVTINENVLKALMVNMTLIGDEDWNDLAGRMGVRVDAMMIAMFATSIDPERSP